MSSKFNIVAELQLRGPKNLNQVTKQIQSKLSKVSTNVNIRLDKKTAAQLKSIAASLNKISAASKQTSAAAKNASTSISKVGNAAKQSAAQLNSAATGAAAFGKQSALAVKRFAAFSVGAGIMMGVANAIKEGTRAAIDFERQMVKISQVTGKTMSNLKGLSSEIGNLSSSLGVSSSELVDVARTLSQTGLAARDVTIAMKALAQSSLAPTFKDMANTAEGAIAIMRQFGVSADQLGKKLGSINALAGQFAVESQDLIFAIRRAGGAFQAAGGSLEELLALFTSVRATTRESAETIATGFRTIFTRIQRPKTIEFLRQSGIELQNLEGNFVGPFEAVKRLSAALKSLDSTDPRFAKIVEELGGFRQVSKVIPLIQQFATAQNALRVAQQGQDSLAKDAATAQQSLATQIAKVREEFLTLFRDLAGSGTFKSITTVILGMASSFIKVADAIKPVLPLLGALAAFQGAKMAFQFGAGFLGGIRGAGGAGAAGANLGGAAGGASRQAQSQAMSKLVTALGANTSALQKLTTAVVALPKQMRLSVMPMGGGRRFATGGIVPGTGNRDTVPAMLTPGEFVIRKSSVKKYGAENLAQMNSGGTVAVQRFANGGMSLPIVAAPGAGLRAAQTSARQTAFAQGRSKALKPFDPEKTALIERGRLAMKVVTKDGGQLAKGFADEDIYGGAFMAHANASAGFKQGNNNQIVLQKVLKSSDGYKKFDSQIQKIKTAAKKVGAPHGPNLLAGAALAEAEAKAVVGKYTSKNEFRIQAGALKKGVSESVEGILLEGVESSVFNAARQISSKVVANTDKNAVYAKMKSANIDQVMGNLFENVLSVTDVPYSPKDSDPANAPFDFPKGLGVNLENFNVPSMSRVKNRPTDAKSNFTSDNLGALLKKVKNFNIEEAGFELDKVFDSMAAKMSKPTQEIMATIFRASGGGISGSDTVPALLTPGEFVVNKKSAQRIGVNNLNAINKGRVQGFASGGPVGVQKFQGGGMATAGNVGMGLMMVPMAAQMLADSFGGLGETTQDLLSTFNTIAMLGGTISMLLPSLSGIPALFTSMGGPLANMVTQFKTAGVLMNSLAVGYVAAGAALLLFGNSVKDAAIKSAENVKTMADERKARENFASGSRMANAGTGMLAGAALGAIAGPVGVVVGSVVGGIIGAVIPPSMAKVEAAIERGRSVQIQKEMSDSLKNIEKNGLRFTNLNDFAESFDRSTRLLNTPDAENREQFRANLDKQMPQVRGLLDKLAASSTSFEDFENKMGGAGKRILESISIVDPSLYRQLKDELQQQIEINNKLRQAKQAEIEAAKEMKNLVRETQNVASAFKDVASIFGTASNNIDNFNSSMEGTAAGRIGSVDTSVIGRAAAGERVSTSQLEDAIRIGSPTEEIATEGFATAQLMSQLPDILSQAARESAGNPDKFQKTFTEVAKSMGFTGKAIEALSTRIGGLAGGRSESEGSIIDEIQEDSAAFAQKIQSDSAKALIAGIQDAAKQQQALFDGVLKINQQIFNTEKKVAQLRLKVIAKESQLLKLQNRNAGRGGALSRAQASAQFQRQQRVILGPENAGAAGNVDALQAGLLNSQQEVIRIQTELANSSNLTAEETIALADELSKASDRSRRFQEALEHMSQSGEELAAVQAELAIAEKKRNFLQDAAFMNVEQQQQLADDSMAGMQIAFNPESAAAQFDEFGNISAEFFQGGRAYLQSLQDMGINELQLADGTTANIDDSLDEFTVQRLGAQSGLQGQELEDFQNSIRAQLQERRRLQDEEAQLVQRQVRAMEALALAMEMQRMEAENERRKADEIKIREDKIKEKETEIEEKEKNVENLREEKAQVDAELEDRETLGDSVAGDRGKLGKVATGGADLSNIQAANESAAELQRDEDRAAGLGSVTGEIGEAVTEAGGTDVSGGNLTAGERKLNQEGLKAAIEAARKVFLRTFSPDVDTAGLRLFMDTFTEELGGIGASERQIQPAFDKAVKAYMDYKRELNQDAQDAGDVSRGNLTSGEGALTDDEVDQLSIDPGAATSAAQRQDDRETERDNTPGAIRPTTGQLQQQSTGLGTEIGSQQGEIDTDRANLGTDRANLTTTRAAPASDFADDFDPGVENQQQQASLNVGQSEMVCPQSNPYFDGKKCYENRLVARMSLPDPDVDDPGVEGKPYEKSELYPQAAGGIKNNERTFKYFSGDLAEPYYSSSGGPFGAGSGPMAGSLSKGTDTRLAVLTPGEFVVNRAATAKNLSLLHAINNGNTINASSGGRIGYFQNGGNGGSGGFGAFTSAVQLFAQAVSSISMSGQGGDSGSTDFTALASALTNFPTSTGVQGLITALNRFSDTFGSNAIEVKMESNGVDVNLNGVEAFANLAESGLMQKVGQVVTARFQDLFQGQDA